MLCLYLVTVYLLTQCVCVCVCVVGHVCVRSDQEVDEGDKQVARCKPEGLDALCRTTKFSRKELQIMYRGFKNVSILNMLILIQSVDQQEK